MPTSFLNASALHFPGSSNFWCLGFDVDLDVYIEPDSVCFKNDTWAVPQNVTVAVEGNDQVDDTTVRMRDIQGELIFAITLNIILIFHSNHSVCYSQCG